MTSTFDLSSWSPIQAFPCSNQILIRLYVQEIVFYNKTWQIFWFNIVTTLITLIHIRESILIWNCTASKTVFQKLIQMTRFKSQTIFSVALFSFLPSLWVQFKRSKDVHTKSNKSSLDRKRFSPPLREEEIKIKQSHEMRWKKMFNM